MPDPDQQPPKPAPLEYESPAPLLSYESPKDRAAGDPPAGLLEGVLCVIAFCGGFGAVIIVNLFIAMSGLHFDTRRSFLGTGALCLGLAGASLWKSVRTLRSAEVLNFDKWLVPPLSLGISLPLILEGVVLVIIGCQ